jgi:hypothetical protein
MEGDSSSQRKRRNSTPGSTKTPVKAVYMRDEDDLDTNEDDELARGAKKNGLKRSKSGSNLGQERKQENEKRKERARALAVETAALPVNTGEYFAFFFLIWSDRSAAQDQLVKAILENDTVIVGATNNSAVRAHTLLGDGRDGFRKINP